MGRLLCVGDRVLCRDNFGNGEARVARVVTIEVCERRRAKYGQRVPEVDWDEQAYLNVTLDNGSWAYGDQIEPYDFALQFSATVERWTRGEEDDLLAALRAWALEDEGLTDQEIWVDVLGNPGLPTVHTTRFIRRERAWPASAEQRLRARVAAVGGDGVTLTATFF